MWFQSVKNCRTKKHPTFSSSADVWRQMPNKPVDCCDLIEERLTLGHTRLREMVPQNVLLKIIRVNVTAELPILAHRSGERFLTTHPAWIRVRWRISLPRYLAECCERRLNQDCFVLLCFAMFTFSAVVFSFSIVSLYLFNPNYCHISQ